MIETAHTFDQHAFKAVKKEANDVQEVELMDGEAAIHP
jgi:hypothetical protein